MTERGTVSAAAPGGEQLLDVREVAGRLGVSPRMVWKLLAAGRLPAPVKLGCLSRWPASEIDRWIRAGCPAAEGGKT